MSKARRRRRTKQWATIKDRRPLSASAIIYIETAMTAARFQMTMQVVKICASSSITIQFRILSAWTGSSGMGALAGRSRTGCAGRGQNALPSFLEYPGAGERAQSDRSR